ncbi:MAG: DNA replication/repair protein RecF [Oscillospiraceae bacterium]
MQVYSIILENFRNYKQESFVFTPDVNVITGANAQGKTTLLEAIYLLTGGRSFRTRFDRELIAFNASAAAVRAEIECGGRDQRIELFFNRGSRRKILKNGVKKTTSELSGELTAVLFSPDDLGMVRDGAAARRRFMDVAIAQLRPKYSALISKYARLYDHKSRILRDFCNKPSLLEPLEEFSISMASTSAQIIRYRAAFLRRIAEKAAEIHCEFSGGREELSLNYKTVSTVKDPTAPATEIFSWVMDHQKSHERAEMESRSCLTGVHKDDIEIAINGISARQFASQGQARTAALSLKLAERLLFFEEFETPPILLLDDVLSELDPKRQEFVLNRIGGGQTFITCCEDDGIAGRTGGKVITIEKGRRV